MGSSLETPVVEQLCDEIVKARQEKLQKAIDSRPQTNRDHLYLSDIHPCTRFLVYSMTHGEKRKPFDPYVKAMLDEGERMEHVVNAQLEEMGFRVVEQGVRIVIKNRKGEIIATGKIDGKLDYKGHRIPVEQKMMGSNVFDRLNEVDDLFKFDHTEKYLRQLLFYMYGENCEEGFFLLNDGRGHWKAIPVYLGNHIAYIEEHLQRIERAFEMKKKGEIPDRIAYSHKLCGGCNFNAVCMPTAIIEGGDALNDPELEAQVEEHESLRPAKKRYDELHESLRDLFTGKPQITLGGRFIILPKKQERASYDYKALNLTKEQLASVKKTTISWSFEVEDLTQKPPKEAE